MTKSRGIKRGVPKQVLLNRTGLDIFCKMNKFDSAICIHWGPNMRITTYGKNQKIRDFMHGIGGSMIDYLQKRMGRDLTPDEFKIVKMMNGCKDEI